MKTRNLMIGLGVAAQRVITHLERAPLGERSLDLGKVSAAGRLELGTDGAGADAGAQAVDQLEGPWREERPDLPEGGGQGGAEGAGAAVIEQVAAHQQRHDLGERQGHRQPIAEGHLDLPEAAAAFALVVDREANLLKDPEVAPDRADGAAELPGGVLHREARRPAEEL